MAWQILIGVLVALAAVWIALVAFLFLAKPQGSTLGDSVRILPDVVRLLRRLAADHTLP